MPHQVCQVHVLCDAIESAYEANRKVKTAMRKQLQPELKAVRKQLKRKPAQATAGEAEQRAVLDDYAPLGGVGTEERWPGTVRLRRRASRRGAG